MKSIGRSIGIAVLSVLGAVSIVSAVSAKEKHQAKIAMADARAKALGLVRGKVVSEELEREKGRWIYSFEIKPVGETGKSIKEVNIDADSGALVSTETEPG